jgi:hypothetical protein
MTRVHTACLLLTLCFSATLVCEERAQAQCAARDVLRNHPKFAEMSYEGARPTPIESAAGARVWKSVQIGTFANKGALYEALENADCQIGDTAEQILVAPEFRLSSTAMKLDVFVVSVAELGIVRENVALKDVFEQAQRLGFALPTAEVGPQLRLQYLDQPIGEFLELAMAPITTRDGSSSIFVVANGGAGLLLLGEEINSTAEFHPSSRFAFVRRTDVAQAGIKPE